MRKPLGISAVVLGVVGTLACATAIILGWWTAARTVSLIGRVTARLDQGLLEADARLVRVEARLNTVRSELNDVRVAAETIVADNPELPRVRAKIEQLLDRLLRGSERADAMADSLRSVAAGLRTAADLKEEFWGDLEPGVRVRHAADTIERAAEALSALQDKVDAMKSTKAAQLTHALVTLAREALAGSERLAEGLAAVRREITVVREWTADWRDGVATWIYVAACAHTLLWMWGGLGQLCLIGWGRRRFSPQNGNSFRSSAAPG